MFDQGLSPNLAAVLIASLFGLVVGSFANVVIYRLPLDRSIVFPPSRCPNCLAAIRPWQNIPVISWVFLRGRCASCGVPIAFRYPAVEALHGAGFAAIVYWFGITPFTPALLLFFFALVVLAFIDWDHQILPDWITLPSLVLGVAATMLPGALISWREAALSAALGYLAFFAVAESYARLRGIEGLGMGDWKLAGMVGAFLGGRRLLLVVFLGSVSGLVYGLTQALRQQGTVLPPTLNPASQPVTSDAPPTLDVPSEESPTDESTGLEAESVPPSIGRYKLPFGTFLAAAAIFVLFFGDSVLKWYSGWFQP